MDEQQTQAQPARRGKRAATADKSLSARQIKKIVEKTLEIDAQDQATRDLLARVLGVRESDTATLAATIMGPARADTSAVRSLESLVLLAERAEIAVTLSVAGREHVNSVWRLVSSLTDQSLGQVPAGDAQASLSLADAVLSLAQDESALTRLGQVESLVRKGW